MAEELTPREQVIAQFVTGTRAERAEARQNLTRTQFIILTDSQVERFVDRARERGSSDELAGRPHKPFFEDTTAMNRDGQILYDDRTAEDAIRAAYRKGREEAKQPEPAK